MIIKNPLIIKKAKLQAKIATPTTSSQTIVADSGYDGLSEVQVMAVTSAIDSNIQAGNIKKDVTILGVTGTLEEGTTPTGTISITKNGTFGVTNYATASVNCPDGTQGLNISGTTVKIPNNMNKEEIIIPENITTINYNDYRIENPYVKKIRTLNKNGLQTEAYIVPTNTNNGSLAGFTNLEELDDRLITGTIQYNFLKGCNTIESIVFKNDISFRSYGAATRAPFNCSNLKKLDFYNISNYVISNYAFTNATKLETLILRNEDGVVDLDATGAIPNQSVIKIYVPSTLLNLYKQATNWVNFANRIFSIDELIENKLPEVIDGTITTLTSDDFGTATSIRPFAFQDMTALVSVTISPNITRIGQYAFVNCVRLTEMTIKATTPPTLDNTNAISSATTTIYIPAGTLSAYQTATNWSSFASKFVELSE